jgi:hypothetical protein
MPVERRKRRQINIHRQQHQFNTHQNRYDILTIEKNTNRPKREQNGGNHQIMD